MGTVTTADIIGTVRIGESRITGESTMARAERNTIPDAAKAYPIRTGASARPDKPRRDVAKALVPHHHTTTNLAYLRQAALTSVAGGNERDDSLPTDIDYGCYPDRLAIRGYGTQDKSDNPTA